MNRLKGWSRTVRDSVMENGSYKIVAMVISIILWLTVMGRKDSTLIRTADIEVQLPESLMLISDVEKKIEVTISGSKLALRKIRSQKVLSMKIDLSSAKPGRRLVPLPVESLDLPKGARVISITPNSLLFELERVRARKFPVVVSSEMIRRWIGKGLKPQSVSPAHLELRGAAPVVDVIKNIELEPMGEQSFEASEKGEYQLKLMPIGLPSQVFVINGPVVVRFKMPPSRAQ